MKLTLTLTKNEKEKNERSPGSETKGKSGLRRTCQCWGRAQTCCGSNHPTIFGCFNCASYRGGNRTHPGAS